MKKILLGLTITVIAFVAFALWRGETTLLSWRATSLPEQSFPTLNAILQRAMIVKQPQNTDGPMPLLVQMHGCGGMNRATHEGWADIAVAAGYMVVIVDSHAPRNIDRDQAIEEVCQGKILLGQERAVDILAAIDLAAKTGPIDRDRIILAGWSHGAWTVMDFLTMAKNDPPAGITDIASNWPTIKAAALFYPHCGLGARSRINEWTQQPDILALIAGADTIVDHQACLKMLGRLSRTGVAIDQTIYPGAEHAFENPNLPADIAHWYNAEFAADATARYTAFLSGFNSSPSE